MVNFSIIKYLLKRIAVKKKDFSNVTSRIQKKKKKKKQLEVLVLLRKHCAMK